ncbi:MAG TPA: HmuY family protein [Balneolaceae bacterium]|nr:HmuY family protein [Balneolaceae bacterium]
MNKYTINTIIIVSLLLIITACSDSTTGVSDEPVSDVNVNLVEDFDARGADGQFSFFSLRSGQEVAHADSATTEWDIAIRGTTILINSGISGPGEGGALLLDVPFDEVEIAPSTGYAEDSDEILAIPKGSGNGWYNYTGGATPQNAILPIEEVTIVLQTGDGNHYAKMEILSYYRGNPDTSTDEFANSETRPDARHYTFRYAIQQIENLRDLE